MLPNGCIVAIGVLIALAVAPAPLAAQDRPAAPTVRAVRGTIRADGRLDEALYSATEAIEAFVQQEPDEGRPATERTEAWVFFDDDTIYVAARCWESRPERRVANEMRRDTNQLRQNDTFAVLFDTFHDRRNGYLFTANAIGGMGDSQITDEGPPNVDWNTVWTFETGEFDGGWTVEMSIPFKSLRYQPGREQTWGINLRRVVRWKNEWSYLAQVPRALTTFRGILKVSSAATLVGLEAPSGTRMLELKPYALSGLATDTTVTPRLSNDATKRIGGDLRYGVTQNLTVDVTVNTDFAQVEVDEQQVNLTRFNLFFPEKRDFFLENLGTFAFAGRASAGLGAGSGVTPYLFFSRRIGLDGARVPSLRAGGRVNGKVGRFTMGLLTVRTGGLAPLEGQPQGIEPATFTVARAKRDILRRSSIGAMVTHRSATPGRVGSNLGYGLDATFSFYQNVRFDTYVAGTRTEGRPGDDLSYRGLFDYNADRYGFTAERLVVEPNFLPEIGFLRRSDMRRNFLQARFSPRPIGIPHVRKFITQGSINYLTNNQNRLDTREIVGVFQTELVNTDVAGVMYTDTFDRPVRPFDVATGVRIPVGGYNFHTLQLSYTGGQQRKISGAIVYETGTYYGGTQQSVSVNSARMEITPRMSVEPSVSVNFVDLPQASFTATVVRTRATYTITPRMFVSAIAQYNSTTASRGSNLRLRWEYAPGSELFVVYTDDYDTLSRTPSGTLRNRAFVIKANRLFRP
ncbi:MAG TPA: DUF5916 domain-containing protein [Vicinamibacterales bacterium]|jgi:hypothetical protein|nr:DUF5916 domain-containing protein [Vicinamibacterales bacterium]